MVDTCKNCGVSLEWYVQVGKNMFCSVACYNAFKKRKVDVLKSKKYKIKNKYQNYDLNDNSF